MFVLHGTHYTIEDKTVKQSEYSATIDAKETINHLCIALLYMKEMTLVCKLLATKFLKHFYSCTIQLLRSSKNAIRFDKLDDIWNVTIYFSLNISTTDEI